MARPVFVFAPGAGAPSTSAWMVRFREHFSRLGPVCAFDYPYRREGRRIPDRLPVLVEEHRCAVEQARSTYPDRCVVLVGKSMGSRVGCHVSLQTPVAALVHLGYPLIGAGKTAKVRDEVLRQLTAASLFVQGERDAMAPLERLRPLLTELSAPTRLHVVVDADHSLESSRTSLTRRGTSREREEEQIMEAVRSFLADTLA